MSLNIIAIILGLIEGLTEFIPVSSTGHLIVFDHFLHFSDMLGDPDKAELFNVVIQLGAVLAVGFLYRARLVGSLMARSGSSNNGRLRLNLIIAFLPAAIIGFALHHKIKELFLTPVPIAIALITGGVAILLIERQTDDGKRTITLDTMSPMDALVVGFAQVLSLFPGTSRSASTIVGGMLRGIKRTSATDFSFMLGFPVMVAASGYELIKYRHLLTSDMMALIGLGFVTAFVISLLIVRWLIAYVQKHSFQDFGIYRIAFGVIILVLYFNQFFS